MAKCDKCCNEAVTITAWGQLCEVCFLEVAEDKERNGLVKTYEDIKKDRKYSKWF